MSSSSLFPQMEEPQALPRHAGPFAAVALELSIDRVLDYAVPASLVHRLKPGQRVRVPLGKRNRPHFGYVVDVHPATDLVHVKPVLAIADDRVLLPPPLVELSCWMSRYYCAALGTVIDGIIPSAVKKRTGLGYTKMVRLARPRDQVQAVVEKTKTPKRRAILARLLQLEADDAIELLKLAREAGSTPATVRKLVKAGLISITPEADFDAISTRHNTPSGSTTADATPHALNEDQRKVFDDLSSRLHAGFSVNLLHGVTGSGKTEIYLRCIREIVDRGARAVVLVPEIALTPQTLSRFTARFARVAVLHSGLAASARHRFWQQISAGKADVVVGARSAVFAPVSDLGIIVVDEEHEPSYKQDQAPRYHARDVAIKRAQLQNIPVLLGSATPSLESWWRATGAEARRHEGTKARSGDSGQRHSDASIENQKSKIENAYHLLSLPSRVRGLQLPHIELVDMKTDLRLRPRGSIHLISQRLEHLLRTTAEAGRQAILLLNRRGYSSFIYCPSCTHLVQCRYCDTTMTYHRSAGLNPGSGKLEKSLHTGQLHCHYCLAVNPLPEKCPDCGKKLSLFGLGTQRVEEELSRKFPGLKYVRVDSDSMRGGVSYDQVLGRFARGEIQVMLGTQVIAKGLDYPNVTLVGVISGDTALSLPDFRAAERTFQLITQVAGRAGRGDHPGRVILQTFMPDDPTIRAAIRQDYIPFAKRELMHRQETGLPPAKRMVRIIARDEDLEKLHQRCEKLMAVLSPIIAGLNGDSGAAKIVVKGPMPCAINRIKGYHRAQVLLFSASAPRLQRVLATVRQTKGFSDADRVSVDVDPVSVL